MDTKNNEILRENFFEIINKHTGIVYKVANAYCDNYDDQQDLVQEIIIQIWGSFEKYDPNYKSSTWIYRIALNVAISQYRKSITRKKHTIPMEDRFANIEIKAEDKEEELQMLQDFIQLLDPLNRALMIMYLDGNTHEEIANVLNISQSNVGTKISRVKEKLKKYFNQN